MSQPAASIPPYCHAISFFQDQRQLCGEVASFAAEGFALDQPALIVTNEAHRTGIVRELRRRDVDVERLVGDGNLLLLDAEETLAGLLRGGLPDGGLYHRNVGDACRLLLRGRPGPLRIFGDMVDLLWQRGEYDAAVRIERLSNELAVLQPISVICGYSMGHFLKTAAKLELVRDLHGRVHEPGSVARPLSA